MSQGLGDAKREGKALLRWARGLWCPTRRKKEKERSIEVRKEFSRGGRRLFEYTFLHEKENG